MHFGLVPLTGKNKLCAKEVIDRSMLLRLQSVLPKYLQEKGFRIERGDMDSVAVHKTVRQYKADMEKKKAALDDSIQKEKKELEAVNEELTVALNQTKSVRKHLSINTMEKELLELRNFKEIAERFLKEHGLLDYFRKLFIHSNNREI